MKRHTKMLLFLLLVSLISPAYAQIKHDPVKDQSISLAEALEIADKNNSQLLTVRKNLDISAAGIDIAKEIPNPQFQAQNSFGPFVALGVTNSVGFAETVELAGKREKRTRLAKSQYQLAFDQFNATRWSVREQTRQAYAAYAAAFANKEALDTLVDDAKRLVGIAQTRFDAGAAPQAEVIQAKLALSQITIQENQAVTQIKQSRLALNRLLGKPLLNDDTLGYTIDDHGIFKLSAHKTALIPQPEGSVLDVNTLYGRAMKARPDLIAAMQQVRASQDQITLLKAQRIPDPQISPAYGYLAFDSKNAPATHPGAGFLGGVTLQLSFTVPIFHNMGPELKQARATLAQSQLQVTQTVQQIQNDIRAAYLAYELDRTNILEYRRKLLPDAEKNLHLARESYRYGKSPLANVILAQQNQAQIVQSYLQTLAGFQTDWANLEQAVGEPLSL